MNQNKKHWWLYVLKLENDKWYVGITSKTPEKRFRQHKNGYLAAAWTRVHKPLEIHDTKDLGVCDISEAQTYEGRVTRKYMEEYGDNNVRGGDLTDTREYIRRFGWIWNKDSWDVSAYIVLLNLIILAIVVNHHNWNIVTFVSFVLATVFFSLSLIKFSK